MIQTVTGAICKRNMGTVLMHEHISCRSLAFDRAFGENWLDRSKLRDLAVETLKRMKQQYGLGLMVDGTPIDLARDVSLLREISELSDVKIVASTGLYHFPTVEIINNSAEEIAVWMTKECTDGIYGTDIKPGILKCATGDEGITADNRKKLSAMALVQKETDLPLYVHCEHANDVVFSQLDVLCSNGADSRKIIIGHTSVCHEIQYLERILQEGCCICMDQCFWFRPVEIAQCLVQLCQKGYTDKILLSNDYCIHSAFCNRQETGIELDAQKHVEGLGFVLDKLRSLFLSAGGSEQDWNKMICQNSINVLDV